MLSNAVRFVLTAACVLGLAGCRPKTVAVTGSVSLDGAPLDEATILFVPLMAGPKKVMARVESGRYRVPAERGLSAGEYRVEVADDPPLAPPTAGMAASNSVPARRRPFPYHYAQDSPLRIAVTAKAGAHTFDFELKSAPPMLR
jgi:hypothetical protein